MAIIFRFIKPLLFIAFLVLSSVKMHGQGMEITGKLAVGTFSMKDLKEFQNEMVPDIDVAIESVDQFQPYFGYGLSFQYRFSSGFGIGIASDLYSTGGRNHYSDYSGYYKLDFLARYVNLLSATSFKKNINEKFSYLLEIYQGFKFSTLILDEEIVISEYNEHAEYDFNSLSWIIKPSVRIEYEIYENLAAGVFVGCEIHPGSNIHLKGDSDLKLTHPDGSNVRINWSGLRFGISLAFGF